jgi:hypothetical protein
MLTRRDLLTRGTTLLLLVPVLGCSMSSSSGTPGPGSCGGINVFSSVDAAHTHTLCVLDSDLTNPPVGGVTYTTSDNGEHTHKVTLAQADLTAIHSGQTVMVTSTSDVDPINGAAHTHTFSISKASSGSGSGSGDPGGW